VEKILQTPSGSRAKLPDETWEQCKSRVLRERRELAAREDQDYSFPVDVSGKLDKYIPLADKISSQIYEQMDVICGKDIANGTAPCLGDSLDLLRTTILECHAHMKVNFCLHL
jgi:hypothetical protein